MAEGEARLSSRRALGYLRFGILIIYTVLVLYYFITGWEGARRFVTVMVPMSVVLWVVDSAYRGEPLVPKVRNVYVNAALGSAFVLISAISGWYIYANFWELVTVRMGFYTGTDLLAGTLLAVLVLWFGAVKYPIIFAIVIFFLINALFGRYFPGILYHPGISYARLMGALSVDFSTGIFESLSQIAATVISAFMLFVGILNGFGLVESTNRLALSKLRSPRLLPQTNILVGIPVGMVTGSAGAATATVGSLTTPIVRDLGVPLSTAAAMAAAAGIGAQLMPPVMGAAAFVMADALGVSYYEVMIRGFVPALVYFVGLAVAIYFISMRYVAGRPSGLAEPRLGARAGFVDYAHVCVFAVGIALLVMLMSQWVYPPTAAIRSAAVVLALAVVLYVALAIKRRESFGNMLRTLTLRAAKSVEFFAVETANLTLLLALLGILKALFTVTGLSLKLGSAIVSAGGGNLYLVILLSYLFGYVVGMGVPPLGTYVIVYPVVVPALMRLGVPAWAAQFTAFFLAVHAEFAPPMSVSAATISRMVRAPFTSVLKELVKMGITLPLIIAVTPLKPQLVLAPGIPQVVAGAFVALGIVGIEVAGYWHLSKSIVLDALLKAALVAASLLTIFSTGAYELLGALVVIAFLAYVFWKIRRARELEAGA